MRAARCVGRPSEEPGGRCERRCTLLYWRNDTLACRICHGLAYASQRERREYRLIGRAQSIRRRLGGTANLTAPFPERPKGMHQQTYARWRDKAAAAEQASAAIIWDWLERRRVRMDLLVALAGAPTRQKADRAAV